MTFYKYLMMASVSPFCVAFSSSRTEFAFCLNPALVIQVDNHHICAVSKRPLVYHSSQQVSPPSDNSTSPSSSPPTAFAPYLETFKLQSYTHTWTYDPICLLHSDPESGADTNICVFTDAAFKNGRGISLIATPESAEQVARHAAFHDSRPSALPRLVSSSSPPPHDEQQPLTPAFEVTALPGRGLGLLATRRIERGETLFSHSPVLIMQAFVETVLPERHLDFLFQQAVQNLPDETRLLYMGLMGHFEEHGEDVDEVRDRFETNAFNLFDFAGVFPETSRLNHACRPNANYHFNKATLTHHVLSLRPIARGEEITISYISPFLTSSARTHRTQNQWGFTCTCALCTSSASSIEASDRRLRDIVSLREKLSSSSSSSSSMEATRVEEKEEKAEAKSSVEDAVRLVELYEEEELYAPIAEAYGLAARQFARVGEREKAREYAERGVEAGVLWKGEGSREVSELKKLLEELSG